MQAFILENELGMHEWNECLRVCCIYSLFHKTLPKSSLLMHWISERFYEKDGSSGVFYNLYWYNLFLDLKKNKLEF